MAAGTVAGRAPFLPELRVLPKLTRGCCRDGYRTKVRSPLLAASQDRPQLLDTWPSPRSSHYRAGYFFKAKKRSSELREGLSRNQLLSDKIN